MKHINIREYLIGHFLRIWLILCITICFNVSNSAKAETVSQKEASKIAELFFNAANGKVMSKPKMVFNGRKFTTSRLFAPYYIYNLPTGGFVIISAENKAYPILGYSLTDTFDADRLTEAQTALLREYARDIEFIRYDSESVDNAFYAWTHIPEYINNLLLTPFKSNDLITMPSAADEIIVKIASSTQASGMVSEIYTPDQWQDLIQQELAKRGNIVIGIIEQDWVHPAIVYGNNGDFFKMWLGSQNNWMMRLMPTEIISFGQIADLLSPHHIVNEPQEDIPFEFYDNFIAESRAAQEAEVKILEDKLNPPNPVIRNNGGGNFEIRLPFKVRTAKVYNIAGGEVVSNKYHNTDTAVINLSAEPNGFYVALLIDENGNNYGVKLYR